MQYLETIMLIALGFVLASLIALFLLRIVWHHGERVGRRRVQQQFPTTSEELRADRARLRAENAMMVRRHEMQIEQFKLQLHERSRQLVQARVQAEELSRQIAERDELIERLRKSQSPLEGELEERTAAVQTLQRSAREYLEQIQRLSRKLEAAQAAIRDRDRTIDDLRRLAASDLTHQHERASFAAPGAPAMPPAAIPAMAAQSLNGRGEPLSVTEEQAIPAIIPEREREPSLGPIPSAAVISALKAADEAETEGDGTAASVAPDADPTGESGSDEPADTATPETADDVSLMDETEETTTGEDSSAADADGKPATQTAGSRLKKFKSARNCKRKGAQAAAGAEAGH